MCFRELHLASILLALHSPLQSPRDYHWTDENSLVQMAPLSAAVNAVYDVSQVRHFGKEKSPNTPLNWTTICYLLNELKLKVDHIVGIE